MVGKKSGRALLKEEGLERTDNNMALTSFPQIPMINQKNYYTEFLKRDEQILAMRLQAEEARNKMIKAARDKDRALAHSGPNGTPADPDVDMDEDGDADEEAETETYGSKTIVIHPGSQNLRLGLATDALPKSVPMVIARRSQHTESEGDNSEPRPKRMKMEDGSVGPSEDWFGDDFKNEYNAMAQDFKIMRRNNKRRVLPNSRELVWNWNSRNPPELIPEHNDPSRIDWTEIPSPAPAVITGQEVLRIPEQSRPKYKLSWPWQNGWLNERDYDDKNMLFNDFFTILSESIKKQLGLKRKKDWSQYSCVFIIPDLYEKVIVSTVLRELLVDFGFQKVCFIQESLAATFGAGYSSSCIVDVGAQKTSICCVDEGMCAENSRVNLKFGGEDITQTFIKMMLFDRFNYSDMNLLRRYDYLLAEELKQKYCTLSDEHISVQLYDFHLRAPNQNTRKYSFKIYDEGMLAALGLFRPNIFDHSHKITHRHKLVERSLDTYEATPNDPMSPAQLQVLQYAQTNIPSAVLAAPISKPKEIAPDVSTPIKPSGLGHLSHLIEDEPTPRSSPAGSPAPDENHTPAPSGATGPQPDTEAQDRTVPIMPLDAAILLSITEAARGDEKKMRDFLGGIMVIGGVSKTANFNSFLEARLRILRPDLAKDVLVGPPPRELDPQVLVWKGGSVFGKLRQTNDSWIGQLEFDRLGARILNYKCMWNW